MKKKTTSVPLSAGWIGMDISKDCSDIALWGDLEAPAMQLGHFPNSQSGAEEAVAWIELQGREVAGIVMEWTGRYSREVAERLMALRPDWPVALINPSLIRAFGQSYGVRNKTDQVDARIIAKYGAERRPAAWCPPEPDRDRIQSIYRTRLRLTQSATAIKNRQDDCPNAAPAAKVALKQVLKVMEKQIAALEKAAAAIIRVHPDWEKDRKLLMSVPGIGPITSLAALAEAGDLRRFRRGRQLVAFLGTSPKRKQSGTSVNGKTRMCRIGGKFLRPALYMAAVALCRLDGPMPDFYRHLVAKGKPPRAALGALMRKLLLVMRSVIESQVVV